MSERPDPDPVEDPLGPAGARPSTTWADPVEEEGARFAREADDEATRPATEGDPAVVDLTPDFLAPAPAPPS